MLHQRHLLPKEKCGSQTKSHDLEPGLSQREICAPADPAFARSCSDHAQPFYHCRNRILHKIRTLQVLLMFGEKSPQTSTPSLKNRRKAVTVVRHNCEHLTEGRTGSCAA